MKTVTVNRRSGICFVELNRPEKKNALNPEMINELSETFHNLASDNQTRVTVIKASGDSFSAGADLEWMKSMKEFSFGENRRDAEALFDMFDAICNCPTPVIVRLHGHVLGGACGLAAVADIAIAEKDTVFGFTEVRLGLVPAVISPYVLLKAPRHRVQAYMLTGETFSAETAFDMGLVQFVEPSIEQVDTRMRKLLDRIFSNSPKAVRSTKKLLKDIFGLPKKEVRRLTTQTISDARISSEGQEGLSAFFEKRAPNWRENLGETQ